MRRYMPSQCGSFVLFSDRVQLAGTDFYQRKLRRYEKSVQQNQDQDDEQIGNNAPERIEAGHAVLDGSKKDRYADGCQFNLSSNDASAHALHKRLSSPA
jgi:hypothetical protein